jgi:hypothetical protein
MTCPRGCRGLIRRGRVSIGPQHRRSADIPFPTLSLRQAWSACYSPKGGRNSESLRLAPRDDASAARRRPYLWARHPPQLCGTTLGCGQPRRRSGVLFAQAQGSNKTTVRSAPSPPSSGPAAGGRRDSGKPASLSWRSLSDPSFSIVARSPDRLANSGCESGTAVDTDRACNPSNAGRPIDRQHKLGTFETDQMSRRL